MSLNWTIDKINDYEELCFIGEGEDERLNPVTNALIWHAMSVSLGSITEMNADTFYARVALVERLIGASVRVGPDPRPITPRDVHSHIGLATNVTSLTNTQWGKQFVASELTTGRFTYTKTIKKEEENP